MQIGSEKWQDVLTRGAAELKIDLPSEDCAAFTAYAQQLLIWSRKINLTAIKDPYEIAVKHFLDSLAPAPMIPPNARLLDIGAGAGFPGLPIKILRPDVAVSLIDASRKKVSFMQQIIRLLDLEKTAAYHVRAELPAGMASTKIPSAEDTQYKSMRAGKPDSSLPVRFDVVIARALTTLKEFISLSLPMLAENGRIIALKGRIEDVEVEEARAYLTSCIAGSDSGPRAWEVNITRYQLPFMNDRRCIVSIYPS